MPGQDLIPQPRPLERAFLTRLHFLWSAPWIGLMTVLCAIGYLLTRPFSPTTAQFKWWAGAWGKAMFFFMGVRIRLSGEENVPTDGPCVFLANHQNGGDIPAVAALLPVPFGFVAKAELEGVPFLGWALRNSPSVFVDKSDPRRSLASIKRAAEQIREGSSVLIFPEGERSYDGHLGTFMKGAFVLAVEAGVPLVPVTIVDAASVFDESRGLSRPGTVHVVVSPPIPLATMTRRDIPHLMEASRASIAAHLPESWRNTPPDGG